MKRERNATSHTDTDTETYTEKVRTPYPLKGVRRSFRGLEPEMRELASEAYAAWRDTAMKLANPYSDHSACLLAGRMAVDAARWEDGLVILAAIRSRMDPKSSPRRIPEWARLEGAEQRGRAHDARKNAEKLERNTIVEHQGTLYLGHVPNVVGLACVICGGDLKGHKLARSPSLRHISEFLP